MSERPKRRTIPLRVQLEVALRQLRELTGADELELDHNPALGLRPVEGRDYRPHQHDPAYLEWRDKAGHKLKTNGRRGESDLSLDSNSDKARIAKAVRLEAKRMEEFRQMLLERLTADPVRRSRPKAKIASRPFPKQKRKMSRGKK